MQHNKVDIEKMMHRLKTRLALANFKRQYGFEQYDLHTLESSLLRNRIKQNIYVGRKKNNELGKHRYYPTINSVANHHPIHKLLAPSLTLRYPVSEKRSTSPQQPHKTMIHTDEDAANVLVMLHNMSSPPTKCI